MNIDAIDLTRKLVNIESISYHEGAVGAFLAEYLAARRYAVERMAVDQHDPARTSGGGAGERFNVYAAGWVLRQWWRLDPHGHRAAVLWLYRGR